jgi:catechol 2,3-dioxygenase-like lactoylglutathione lyase family enzyme
MNRASTEPRAIHTTTNGARYADKELANMPDPDFPAPSEGFVVTHFIVSADIAASRDFYEGVLGGKTVLDDGVTVVKLANTWIIINSGGGPTDDKPEVVLDVPADPNKVSAFLNLRVADIDAVYKEWSVKGATFLTPPIDRGREIRCFMRDPDGHLIEVGQTTGVLDQI